VFLSTFPSGSCLNLNFPFTGPSSVFSSASILFQRKWGTGSKGNIEAQLIVHFFNSLFFLWLNNRN
jgi:hypothetical protein